MLHSNRQLIQYSKRKVVGKQTLSYLVVNANCTTAIEENFTTFTYTLTLRSGNPISTTVTNMKRYAEGYRFATCNSKKDWQQIKYLSIVD